MRALHRAPKGGALACLAAGLAGLCACGLNNEGVAPPRDRISFPSSVKADPDGRWLYVTNSNADLRYNNGTIVAVDLDAVAADREGDWEVCPRADYLPPSQTPEHFCCWDYLDHSILDCDERPYIPAETTIEIGSFGAGMALQPLADSAAVCDPQRTNVPVNRHDCHRACDGVDPVAARIYVGVRGNSSITYVDVSRTVDGERPILTCPASGSTSEAKDCAVTDMEPHNALPPAVVPEEPYSLLLDRPRDLLYVGHLRGDIAHPNTGGVSLFDTKNAHEGGPPKFLTPSPAFFPSDAGGFFGVSSLTLKSGNLYATSRITPLATRIVTVVPQVLCEAQEDPSNFYLAGTSETYTSPLFGTELRGIQFLPKRQASAPTRAFVLQRTPPALIGFDAAMGENGVFGNFPTDILETCQAPTFLQKDRTEEEEAAGADDSHLYVSCFESGQVYVFDPHVPRLVAAIDVGRGPAGLEFAKPKAGDARRLAYIVGFGSNNIGVLDLTPGSPTQNHIIQRIGFPSVVPR